MIILDWRLLLSIRTHTRSIPKMMNTRTLFSKSHRKTMNEIIFHRKKVLAGVNFSENKCIAAFFDILTHFYLKASQVAKLNSQENLLHWATRKWLSHFCGYLLQDWTTMKGRNESYPKGRFEILVPNQMLMVNYLNSLVVLRDSWLQKRRNLNNEQQKGINVGKIHC